MLPPRLGGGTGARKQGTGGAGPRHGASHGVLSQGMSCERRAGKYGAGTLRASSPRSAVGPSSGCPGLPSAVGTLPRLVGPPLSVQRPVFGPGSPSVLGFNSHFSLPCSVRLPLCLLWAFCSCSGSPAVLGLPLWFGSPLPGGPPAHLSASHFVVVLPSPLGLPASFRPLLPAGPCPWCTHGISAAGEGARAVTACPAPLSAEPGPRSGSGGDCAAQECARCRGLGYSRDELAAGAWHRAGGQRGALGSPTSSWSRATPQTWDRGVLAQLGALLSCTVLK